LRLDTFEGATATHKWGRAIVPGKPDQSALIERITSDDPDERMPPPESHLTLSDAEKQTLRKWIVEGAEYDVHWAFKTPVKPALPKLDAAHKAWVRNGIDHFVAAKLGKEGLKPSSEADKRTLLRRVTLDLTGLPPTPAEIDAFLKDKSPNAYDKVVDRLLASPSYGEHMTFTWLDAARYADTDGYQNDAPRTMWPWRDWVIRAYNANMPFDQFTIEQLAGDMLPKPSIEQLLATGFNRNHRINNEGGALPEEFIVEYVADRVETTGSVWLGLTFGCARCHDHKYDPLYQKEYFQMFAIFNGINERGKDRGASAQPNLLVPKDPNSKEIANAEAALAKAKEAADQAEGTLADRQEAWEAVLAKPLQWQSSSVEKTDDKLVIAIDAPAVSAVRIKSQDPAVAVPARASVSVIPPGDESLVGRYVRVQIPAKKRQKFYLGLAEVEVFSGGENLARKGKARQSTTGYGGVASRAIDGNTNPVYGKGSITHTNEEKSPWWEVDLGRSVAVSEIKIWNRHENLHSRMNGAQVQLLDEGRDAIWTGNVGKATPQVKEFSLSGVQSFEVAADETGAFPFPKQVKLVPKSRLEIVGIKDNKTVPIPAVTLDYCSDARASQNGQLPASISKIVAIPSDKRSNNQLAAIAKHYRGIDQTLADANAVAKAKQDALNVANKRNAVTVMVMSEMATPRPTYVLDRGQYDKPIKDEVLTPDVPASLSMGINERPRNRLQLAQWLVSEQNPLTSRVTVNRYWQKYFGVGLVKTAEDFGTQGEWPSHPQLIDWLAVTFRESGWDIKGMQKLIVTSATYRQSSKVSAELQARDPQNRLLARGPRFRLSAPMLRDQALAVSGLRNPQLGGPPVKPYQPDGLWNSVAGGANNRYTRDKGDKLYRRSMYTFWKRAVAPPRMTIFDAAGRDMCKVNVKVTNTPLQALALMNDVTHVEAARALAQRMIKEGGSSPEERIAFGYELASGDEADVETLKILGDSLTRYRKHYQSSPEATKALLSAGESPRDDSLPPVEHAAYMVVANTILNLDTVVTKE
jgi:hypothetical protein